MVLLASLIAGLLFIATLLVLFLRHKRKSDELHNNVLRLRTWWAIFAVCIPVFYIGDWAILAFSYALILWATLEFLRLLNVTLTARRVTLFVFLLIGYTLLTFLLPELLTLYFLVPFLILSLLLITATKYSRMTKTKTFLGFAYCATSLLSIHLIWDYTHSLYYDAGLIILFLFFITASNDIFQYISGKALGRTPLTPNLSQKKTLEGAIGGILLTGLVCALALPQFLNVTTAIAFIVGLILSILGIIGDLVISYFKRQANVKDSGNSLPGHGGLLDRIDSLLLSAPGFGLCLGYLL